MKPTETDADAARAVVIEYEFPQPPEKVWRVLTEPDLVAAWLLADAIKPEVGHRFSVRKPPAANSVAHCEVLAAEPNRLLRYSWRTTAAPGDQNGEGEGALDTTVTFELTKTARGGTHLRLVHSGFPPALRRPLQARAGKLHTLPRRAHTPINMNAGGIRWAA